MKPDFDTLVCRVAFAVLVASLTVAFLCGAAALIKVTLDFVLK